MINEGSTDILEIISGISGFLVIINIVLTIVSLTLKKITGHTSLIILAVALITPLLGALVALFFADGFVDGLGLTFTGALFGLAVSEILLFIYLIVSLAKKKAEPLELIE